MKAITYQQWVKMNARQRSWMVCRALGNGANVYWHCTKPDGSLVGGSFSRRDECLDCIEFAKKLTLKEAVKHGVPYPHPFADCTPRPAVAYPMYADYDHVGIRLGMDLLKEHGSFSLNAQGPLITARAGKKQARGESIQEAVSLLILKLRGFLKERGAA